MIIIEKIKKNSPLILISFFILIIFFEVIFWRADYYYLQAIKAQLRDDCLAVSDEMEKALYFNPWRLEYLNEYINLEAKCFNKLKNKEDKLLVYKNLIQRVNVLNDSEINWHTRNYLAYFYSILALEFNPFYFDLSEKEYKKLITLNGDFVQLHRNLGRVYLWSRKYDQAIFELNEALKLIVPTDDLKINEDHRNEIKSELKIIYRYLGETYLAQKNYDQAIIFFNKTLVLDPRDSNIYKALANAFYKKKNIEKADWYNKRADLFKNL